jgi:4'-phosphopantetheinyl transferase
MLDLLFVRLATGTSEPRPRASLVALHHETGEALARYYLRQTGRPHPAPFPRGVHGKPRLSDRDDLFFNISHAGEIVVVAFSDREIGVDVERHGRARLDVSSRFFHPDEHAMLLAADEVTRERLFTELWAIKESFVKYLGTGISRPLSSFRVSREGPRVVLYEEAVALPLHVHACPLAPGHACFTCGESPSLPRLQEVEPGSFS